MSQTGEQVRVISSHRKPGWLIVVLLVAIVVKSLIHFYYRQLDGDKITQLAAAVSITKGNGYTLPLLHPDNLSVVHHERLIEWPPFYSFLVAPILKATNYDYDQTAFIADVLSIILYLTFILLIVWELGFPSWLCALLLLYRASEINGIIQSSAPTDYFGVGFWLISLYCWLRFLKDQKTFQLSMAVFFAAITPLIRYMYLPFILILPACLLVHAYLNRNRKNILVGWTTLFAAIVVVALPLLFNYFATGKAYYIYETQKGFYPENIQYFGPIFWSAFLNLDFIVYQLSIHDFPANKIAVLLKITNVIILFGLALRYFFTFFLKGGLRSNEPITRFFGCAGALAVCNIAVLFYVSFSIDYYSATLGFYYSFVQESRYFILAQVVIVLAVFYYAFVAKSGKPPSYFLKTLRIILLLIVVAEAAHGPWMLAKRTGAFKAHILPASTVENFIDSLVREANKQDIDIVLTGDPHFASYAILKNLKAIRFSPEINDAPIHAEKKTILLIRIPEIHRKRNEALLNRKGLIPVGKSGSNSYYIMYLSPGTTPYEKRSG